MKLIDKSALVAEIERLRQKVMGVRTDFADGQKEVLTELLSFIDSLQKESVGMEKNKFKEGDLIAPVGTTMRIVQVFDDTYQCERNGKIIILFKQSEDQWELVEEPKPHYPFFEESQGEVILYGINGSVGMQEKSRFHVGQTITDPTDPTFTFHINRIENGKYIESDDAWVLIKDADEEYQLVEEPVSEDLEKAIDTYLATYFGSEKEKQEWPFLKKMAIYFAEWQKQKDSIPVSEDLKEEVIKKVLYFSENFHEAPWAIDSTGAVMPIWYAKFGANWQKQKMMKDAVEAAVNTYEEIGGKGYVEFVANVPVSQYKGEHGVKIIIIKEK